MAHKQTGNPFPLIVTDIYGVILLDDKFDFEYLDLLKNLSTDCRVAAYSSLSDSYLDELAQQDELEFVSRFYSASSNGWPKHSPDSYLQLAKAEGFQPSDIIFIDDSTHNIEASERSGIAGILHRSVAQTIRSLTQLGVLS